MFPKVLVRPYATERAAKPVEAVQLHGIPALSGGTLAGRCSFAAFTARGSSGTDVDARSSSPTSS
jgi:hypothetical protein